MTLDINDFRKKKAITYSDFVRLCRVEDPEDLGLNYRLEDDGVYLTPPPKDVFLTPEERAIAGELPPGVYSYDQPVLKLPCSLQQLQKFQEDGGLYGITDAFDMADVIFDLTIKEIQLDAQDDDHQSEIAALQKKTKKLKAKIRKKEENPFEFHPDDECYPEELDIALIVWSHASKNWKNDRHVKSKISEWLRSNYPDLDEAQYGRIAVMANFRKHPGPGNQTPEN